MNNKMPKYFEPVVATLLFSIVGFALYEIFHGYNLLTDPWQGLADIEGTFGNTSVFGGFMGFATVAGVGLLSFPNLFKQSKIFRISICLLLVPIVIMLIISRSRAGWIAAGIGVLFIFADSVIRAIHSPKMPKFVLCTLVAILVAVVFALYHFKKSSADGRLLIWTVSSRLLDDKPFTGLGFGGFQKYYLLEQADYFKEHPDSPFADLADDAAHPFNEFLKIAIEQGFVGLIIALLAVWLSISRTYRASQSIKTSAAVFLATIIFACFSYPFEYVEFRAIAIIYLLLTGYVIYHVKITPALSKKIFTFTILYISILYLILRPLPPNPPQSNLEIRKLINDNRFDEAIDLLKQTVEKNPNSQNLILLAELYEKTDNTDSAIIALQTASYIKPCLFEPHYRLAKIHLQSGDTLQAVEKAEYLLNKPIKVQSLKLTRILKEMKEIVSFNHSINQKNKKE